MIHQFAELGQFYLAREGVADQLRQYAADPSAKFRCKEVLALVFSSHGFERVLVEEYDESRRLRCLYRAGPSNGCDATPTTGMPAVKKGQESTAPSEIRKKLDRLARSVDEALGQAGELPAWEAEALALMRDYLESPEKKSARLQKSKLPAIMCVLSDESQSAIVAHIQQTHPDPKQPAILTVAWRTPEGETRWVGDFKAFQQALVCRGKEAASKKKGIKGDVKGIGQCCICGLRGVEVSGLLQIPNFKIYTLDKPGAVSGGFDPLDAWHNFPACRECCDKVDFSGERIKKELSFDYYSGFKYLLLPSPMRGGPTDAYHTLNRLVSARVDRKASKRLTDAEDDLFEIVAEENNLLQVDLLFYQPDLQSFRPVLYVSGLVPTRFRELFKAQSGVERHTWLQEPSPKGRFTFGCLRNVFPAAHGGSTFNDDFLAATRSALELRCHSPARMLEIGMRWVQQDFLEGEDWRGRLADLFRCLLFFELLTRSSKERNQQAMVDYGNTEQAGRVRQVFEQAPETNRLRFDPAAQAIFLVGACCGRIETIQSLVRGSTPFEGKYKGFRLTQADIQRLFTAVKDKAKAYGPEKERIVSGLLACAASALASTPERWVLGPDDISYYFALGHALRGRLAKDDENESDSTSTMEG